MEATHVMVGSINDSGILQGLNRKGFIPPKCLSELKANSIDAKANSILYSITASHIKIIDDGNGMKKEAIRNMFDMHKENHAGEKTLGVSGVGGKVSTMVLSEQKTVMMYTKSRDGAYYSITIPWDIMFKEGKYSEMIKVQNMSENEIIDFQKERENMKNKDSGVSIWFPYNDRLVTEIEKQFTLPNDDIENQLSIENQLCFIYGGFSIDVKYKHYEKPDETMQMIKYDYFGGENNEYYKGKTHEIIKLYEKKNKYRYIWEKKDNLFEIKNKGKGFSKDPEPITESLSTWKHLGDYSVLVGCRRDEKYFTETTTEMPQSALDIPLEYEKKHFGESKCIVLCKPQLIRNGQIICSFDLPDVKISNRRGNAKAMFQIRHVKCYLLYDPISNLDNKQDLLCGIQENKNQCTCLLEIPFLRLIKDIKHKKEEEIWSYFEGIVERNKIPPAVKSNSYEEPVNDNQEPPNQEPSNQEPSNQEPIHEEPPNQEPIHEKPPNQEPIHPEPPNQEPPNQEPIHPEPTNQEPPNQEPPNQEPPNQEPIHEEPIHEEPSNQEPSNQEPPNQEPIHEEPPNQELQNQELSNEIYAYVETDINSEDKKNLHSIILLLQEKLKSAEEKIKYLEDENNKLRLIYPKTSIKYI
jgi:hypothetical protein